MLPAGPVASMFTAMTVTNIASDNRLPTVSMMPMLP